MSKIIKHGYKESKIQKYNFVSKKDIEVLKNLGINYKQDIKIFLKEIQMFFNESWSKEFYIENSLNSLEELNHKYLLDYPSTGGYYLLEDSFTCYYSKILSDKSKIILGYLYNIHLK